MAPSNPTSETRSDSNKNAVAMYPGSFDPIHNGHLAVIATAAKIFDHLIVAVGQNSTKHGELLNAAQRVEIIQTVLAASPETKNVEVKSFEGLVTNAAKDSGVTCLVKGVRGPSDLEAEMMQAKMNFESGGALPTIFVPAIAQYADVSSRYIREIWSFGGQISSVVPPEVVEYLESLR